MTYNFLYGDTMLFQEERARAVREVVRACAPDVLGVRYAATGWWYRRPRMNRSDRHDDPPEPSTLTDAELAPMLGFMNSEYYHYVEALNPAVKGKVVRSSEAGAGGFVLRFADETWVVVFLTDGRMRYTVGDGAVPEEVSRALHSTEAADGRAPLTVDLPYADETCDLAAALARCHGQAINGLAIGAQCFNFCFPGGYELGTMVVPTARGPALRVFWERW